MPKALNISQLKEKLAEELDDIDFNKKTLEKSLAFVTKYAESASHPTKLYKFKPCKKLDGGFSFDDYGQSPWLGVVLDYAWNRIEDPLVRLKFMCTFFGNGKGPGFAFGTNTSNNCQCVRMLGDPSGEMGDFEGVFVETIKQIVEKAKEEEKRGIKPTKKKRTELGSILKDLDFVDADLDCDEFWEYGAPRDDLWKKTGRGRYLSPSFNT